jgi:hypothetical protein
MYNIHNILPHFTCDGVINEGMHTSWLEQRSENPCVTGSNLLPDSPLAQRHFKRLRVEEDIDTNHSNPQTTQTVDSTSYDAFRVTGQEYGMHNQITRPASNAVMS